MSRWVIEHTEAMLATGSRWLQTIARIAEMREELADPPQMGWRLEQPALAGPLPVEQRRRSA
jgi:hypothetical protein